jgi:hypothetical protein
MFFLAKRRSAAFNYTEGEEKQMKHIQQVLRNRCVQGGLNYLTPVIPAPHQ